MARFSLGALILYIPAETLVSWPELLSPGYLVDVLAFGLLLFGGWHSLRARPAPAAGPLCAAWGFCACLAWRSYFLRVYSRQRGLGLYHEPGYIEPVLAVVLVIALAALAVMLWIAWVPRIR